MHAAAPPATKPCPRVATRFRITAHRRPAVAAASPPPSGRFDGIPDLNDPRMRALPISVLALAFAVAGLRGSIAGAETP